MASYVSTKTHLLQAALLNSRFKELISEMQKTSSCQPGQFNPRIAELSKRVDEMRRTKLSLLQDSIREMEGYVKKARALLLHRSSSAPSHVDRLCSPKVLKIDTRTASGSPSFFTPPYHRSLSVPAHVNRSCNPNILRMQTGSSSPSSFTPAYHRSFSTPTHIDKSCNPKVLGMQSSSSSSSPFKFRSVELFESALQESQLCDLRFEMEIEGPINALRQEIESSPHCLWSQFNLRINELCDKIDQIAQDDVSYFSKLKRLVEDTRILLFKHSTMRNIDRFYIMSCLKEESCLLSQYEKVNSEFQLLHRNVCEFELGLANRKHSSLEKGKRLLKKAKSTIRDRISAYKKRMQEEALPPASSDKISAPALLEKTKQLLALCGLLDEGRVEEVMHSLMTMQTRIHFEASSMEMTIYECVCSHHKEGIVLSTSPLKKAIKYTCIQLALQGFTMMLKEKGRLPAQEMFKELFNYLGIWEKYCHLEDVWLQQNKEMSREEEMSRTTGALCELYISLF